MHLRVLTFIYVCSLVVLPLMLYSVRLCTCARVRLYTHTHTYMQAHTLHAIVTCMYACTSTCTQALICLHNYICTCICICMIIVFLVRADCRFCCLAWGVSRYMSGLCGFLGLFRPLPKDRRSKFPRGLRRHPRGVLAHPPNLEVFLGPGGLSGLIRPLPEA